MKVSVIIPTHNRPELLKGAIASVLAQTYRDLELIIVDDGLKSRAESLVQSFNDSRITYIAHDKEKGGGTARNTGLRRAQGDFIAFLDDDDEWLPEKLQIQMQEFEKTSPKVGFCFCAVENVYTNHREITTVPVGEADYFETALVLFKAFLTVTLIIKKEVINDVGYFDESLPSHQETDLVLRMAKKYHGLGINEPLVKVNMKSGHERTGSSIKRRIAGREMLLKKYHADLVSRPKVLAQHLFWLGLFYRDDHNFNRARELFFRAFKLDPRLLYLGHLLSVALGSFPYRFMILFRS